jgi:hypothetical protein
MRVVAGRVLSVLAILIVWFALVFPDRLDRLTPASLVRIPVEGLVVVALALVVPQRTRRIGAVAVGVLAGALAVIKLLDMGFWTALDRPFNPVTDWSTFGPAVGLLRDSVGPVWAVVVEIGVVVLVVAVLVIVPLSLLRVTRLTSSHRVMSARVIGALGIIWVGCAAVGTPVASTATTRLAYEQLHDVRAAIHDRQVFASALSAPDAMADTPTANLLTGLRGKDVIVAFVESYGRVAVQGSEFSPQVDQVLDAGTRTLHSVGFDSRSAFLRSPTFGGISWLAHSTFQSGMWVDSQQRYDQLVASKRYTLSDAFGRAGWRTVGDVPPNRQAWPEGRSFYHYDQLYDQHNVGYAGPKFSYAPIPDQYTLSAFRRLELAKPGRQPVMAEIDLVSSHTPWTPLPHLVGWNEIGDGSVYDDMAAEGKSRAEVWRHADQVRAAYGNSIEYSLRTLISYVQTYPDPNLVLVVLGDHQPATIVSGTGADRDVPISIVAHDPSVLSRISSWGWQDGLRPHPQAPVWPMSSVRNRFLSAFSS